MGFGHHAGDKRMFYRRLANKNGSFFARMVQDVQSAVDLLTAPFNGSHPDGLPIKAQYGHWYPPVDASQVFVAGYSLGGLVGSFAAALDARIAGVGIMSGLSSMRNEVDVWKYGGLDVLSDLHGLLPQVGRYLNQPSKLPFDLDLILQAISPRPTLVYNQLQDRTVYQPALNEILNSAKSNCKHLQIVTSNSTSKLDDDMASALISFLSSNSS